MGIHHTIAKSLPKLVFSFGLLLLPFIYWPWATIPYEIPRVLFVERWVELLVVTGIIGIIVFPERHFIDRKIFYLILVFCVASFLSAFLGVDGAKSISGNYWRLDGLITYIHLFGLSIFLTLFWKKDWSIGTSVAIIAGAVGTVLWGFISHPSFSAAFGSTFGQPRFLTGYLLVTLPFAVFLRSQTKIWILRGLLLGCLAILICGIILTQSRAGILGIGLFFCGWFWIAFHGRRRKLFLKVFFVGVIVIAFWQIRMYLASRSPYYFMNPEAHERIFIKGVLAFFKRPIFGWGWANFDHAFTAVDWPYHFNHDLYVDKAHSMFLEILVTTGLVGFVPYIALFWCVLQKYWQQTESFYKYLLLCLLLYLFHAQTNVLSIAEEVIFWMIAGIAGS